MELRRALTARLAALTLLTMGGLALSTPAHGDERSEAEARFYEGTALYQKGKYDEARLKFAQAYAVLKKSSVLFNLAKTEALTGHRVEAANHFREYVKYAATGTDKAEAEKELAELYKLLARVEVEAPEGAAIFVDGAQLGLAPIKDPVVLNAGKHTVSAQFGEAKQEKPIDGLAGSLGRVVFTFEKPAPAPAPTPTPAPSASSSGYTYTPPPPPKDDSPGAGRWIGPVAFGLVGAAGVIVGVGFAGASHSAADDATALRTTNPKLCTNQGSADCAAYQTKLDDISSARRWSWVGYGVGAGGLVIAGVWTALNLRSPSKSAWSASPALGSGVATMTFATIF